MRIKTFLLTLTQSLLLSALCFVTFSCKDEIAVIGHPAPEIAAFDLQGNKVSLAEWRGKTILLNFWSETCGVCINELKTFEQYQHRHPNNNLHIIAINVDGEKADTQAIVSKREIQLFIVKDQLKMTAERYQLIGTPTSFVIDPEGKILYKFEGLIPNQALDTLFKG
ncbi:ResA protein [Pasteurella multocida subsp. multocida OH4807]|nr:ResA protein [Pasteurella multocida subsp. multocida OH4807]